ncbi:Bax inhibitor-1 family protein [Kangiella sp. HZ709]|uniref:Bax inhibitor-1/YccA family protein n=1 Tax=Kangiella sp. HZ709 TaxID=2666328 RepID=UPI0012B05932|nr:Bax inhibitor-1 family protein [Kangiella sp. HZ709]MRX28595.1 permease [Kangiella sp. HZ709]
MSYQEVNDAYRTPVSQVSVDRRSAFITKTYNHLLAAIIAFTLISVYLYQSGISTKIAIFMSSLGTIGMIAMVAAFVGIGWFASRYAGSSDSKAVQYLNLVIFTALYAVFFSPLLLMAIVKAPGMIESAVGVTLAGTAILTAIAFFTRKDFSFLKGLVYWGVGLALVAIVGGFIFGYNLGIWFSVIMIGISGASILYDTSNIIHHYPEDKYVAASIHLFSSIAMLFIYVLRLFMAFGED